MYRSPTHKTLMTMVLSYYVFSKESFYEELAENHLNGNPLFTRVAIYNNHSHDNTFDATTTFHTSPTPNRQSPFSQLDDLEAGVLHNTNPLLASTTGSTISSNSSSFSENEGDVIAGCVVGSFMSVTRMSQTMRDLLVNDPLTHYNIFYIMTLGTVDRFRGAGLGTQLVQQCMDQVSNDPSCGVLYLHVITTNDGAIRLYEKLGFFRVQEIPDYYDIDGEKFPSYLYVKYFHGNQGHRHIIKVIRRCVYRVVSSIWNQVSHLSGENHSSLLDPEGGRSMADESDPGL